MQIYSIKKEFLRGIFVKNSILENSEEILNNRSTAINIEVKSQYGNVFQSKKTDRFNQFHQTTKIIYLMFVKRTNLMTLPSLIPPHTHTRSYDREKEVVPHPLGEEGGRRVSI